jgi:hypothetical protein
MWRRPPCTRPSAFRHACACPPPCGQTPWRALWRRWADQRCCSTVYLVTVLMQASAVLLLGAVVGPGWLPSRVCWLAHVLT